MAEKVKKKNSVEICDKNSQNFPKNITQQELHEQIYRKKILSISISISI